MSPTKTKLDLDAILHRSAFEFQHRGEPAYADVAEHLLDTDLLALIAEVAKLRAELREKLDAHH